MSDVYRRMEYGRLRQSVEQIKESRRIKEGIDGIVGTDEEVRRGLSDVERDPVWYAVEVLSDEKEINEFIDAYMSETDPEGAKMRLRIAAKYNPTANREEEKYKAAWQEVLGAKGYLHRPPMPKQEVENILSGKSR